ncbi:MAG: hypothetical protein ABSF50_21440 [Burkholderiaceae bacterium]|jgi:hypothetical protein
MTTKQILRAAALVTLLLAAGHSMGGPWTPDTSVPGQGIVEGMKMHTFDAMGAERTYYSFYVGFGWLIAAYLFGQTALFWLLGDWAVEAPRSAFRVIVVLCLQWLVVALLSSWFIFVVPGVLAAAIFLLVLGAAVSVSRGRVPAPVEASSTFFPETARERVE